MKLTLNAISAFLIIFSFTLNSFAESRVHSFTKEQSKYMKEMNKYVKENSQDIFKKPIPEEGLVLPYGEYEDQGYFIFNDETDFASYEAKRGFLENLPEGITPVMFTQNESPEYIQSLKETYGSLLKDSSLLKIMYLDVWGNGFWARDGIPVPMYYRQDGKDHFLVVDAKYYHDFEPDQKVADRFNAIVWSHDYYFEGGNFIANEVGDCLVVDNERVEEIPDAIFEVQYGCRNLIRLPYIRGIGHADESVKFISPEIVLTDLPEYKEILEDEGFQVVMLPRAKLRYETYINSVILGKTIYMPAYGYDSDEEALNVYRSLGYNPIPLNSYSLSNQGAGSLHCISMVYPKTVSFNDFLEATQGEVIR